MCMFVTLGGKRPCLYKTSFRAYIHAQYGAKGIVVSQLKFPHLVTKGNRLSDYVVADADASVLLSAK